MINAAFILSDAAFQKIYGDHVLKQIEPHGRLLSPPVSAESLAKNTPPWAAEMEALFTGWEGPLLDAETLAKFPRLKVVFYGAGTLRTIIRDGEWPAHIQFTAAASFNAVPTSEFAFGLILLSLKRAWLAAARYHEVHEYPHLPVAGGKGSTIGVISLGQIGRRVIKRLHTLDVNILAHDPHADSEKFAELGVKESTKEEIFSQSDVITLHAPLLDSTRGMVDGRLLGLMKPNATLVNTARGGLVKELELIDFLQVRSDVQAALDVTDPEPPAADSPLWTLPNVFLTPHIAGSMGEECRRMGEAMIEEFRRYARGESLHYAVTQAQFENMA